MMESLETPKVANRSLLLSLLVRRWSGVEEVCTACCTAKTSRCSSTFHCVSPSPCALTFSHCFFFFFQNKTPLFLAGVSVCYAISRLSRLKRICLHIIFAHEGLWFLQFVLPCQLQVEYIKIYEVAKVHPVVGGDCHSSLTALCTSSKFFSPNPVCQRWWL